MNLTCKNPLLSVLTSLATASALFISSTGIASASDLEDYTTRPTQTAYISKDNFISFESKASLVEGVADEANEALGLISTRKKIRPTSEGGILSFHSTEGLNAVNLKQNGFSIFPLELGDETPLLSVDYLSDSSHSLRPDGTSVFIGEKNHFLIDSYSDTSIRIQTVIESQDADHEIKFKLGLDDDEVAKKESDGSIGFYRTFKGEETEALTSIIESPWAVDSLGQPVSTWFKLEGNQLVQVVDASAEVAYPVVADPFWIPAIIVGLRVGVQVLIKVGSRVVKYAVAPASRVVNALKNFTTLTFRAGSNTVRLDKAGMKHILERHHPQYWNGTAKSAQSFFNPKMSVSNLKKVIHDALKNHASAIRGMGGKSGTYSGTSNGVKYNMTISNGRVVQFYPR